MTEIDLCNLALSSLGHERQLSALADQTREAQLCALWIKHARQNVLSEAWWEGLALFTPLLNGVAEGGNAASSGLYRYWLPADVLRKAAYSPNGQELDIFMQDGAALLMREPQARFRMVIDEPDPEAWPHRVQLAVAATLAAVIAYPLTGSRTGADAADKHARATLSNARAANAQITRPHGEENRYTAARSSQGWS